MSFKGSDWLTRTEISRVYIFDKIITLIAAHVLLMIYFKEFTMQIFPFSAHIQEKRLAELCREKESSFENHISKSVDLDHQNKFETQFFKMM
jgi:hypothetical protein